MSNIFNQVAGSIKIGGMGEGTDRSIFMDFPCWKGLLDYLDYYGVSYRILPREQDERYFWNEEFPAEGYVIELNYIIFKSYFQYCLIFHLGDLYRFLHLDQMF